jgi:hypothetical protein
MIYKKNYVRWALAKAKNSQPILNSTTIYFKEKPVLAMERKIDSQIRHAHKNLFKTQPLG